MIKTKNLREPADESDVTRIYIGRRYPRGIKDGTLWQERVHDLGPSLALHRAVLHEGLSLDEYERRFLSEMSRSPAKELIRSLAARSKRGETLTFLCDHPKALPAERCHRFLVQRLVEKETHRSD